MTPEQENLESESTPIESEETHETRVNAIESQLKDSEDRIESLRELLVENPTLETELEAALASREILLEKHVEAKANYPLDWTELLHERLRDPITKEKFIRERTEALAEMKEGTPAFLDKPEAFRQHYEAQIDSYDENVEELFKSTDLRDASEFGKRPIHLGRGHIGETGTVFRNAEHKDGSPLTTRQKNITEAHEKGHGIRDFTSPKEVAELRAVLDTGVLDKIVQQAKESGVRFPRSHLTEPDEIVERMAQLKNYFGMSADEEFTRAHLAHAREHYVRDTELDNSMTAFFACITPATEKHFLSIINTYPI